MRTTILGVTLLVSRLGPGKMEMLFRDKVLLIDDYRTLEAFENVYGSLWIVTDRGINIYKDGQWKKATKKLSC